MYGEEVCIGSKDIGVAQVAMHRCVVMGARLVIIDSWLAADDKYDS